MVSRINETETTWISYTPGGLTDPSIVQEGNESLIMWGAPLVTGGPQSVLRIRGLMPPIRVFSLNANFKLAKLRYTRTSVTGTAPTTFTAQVDIDFHDTGISSADLVFTVSVAGVIGLDGSFPQEVAFGDRTIEFLGFEAPDGVDDTFTAAVGQSIEVYLISRITQEIEDEDTGPPVFDPKYCEMPAVAPIDPFDVPMFQDCSVPAAVEPTVDCPEIDLPSVAAIGMQEVVGEMGPPGEDGQDGQDGPPGCKPKITVSSEHRCVTNCAQTRVVVFQFDVLNVPDEPCWTHFHFRFFICCPPTHRPLELDCCVWVWCPCDNYYVHGEANNETTPTVDNNCPKTDTCVYAPGYWKLYRTGGGGGGAGGGYYEGSPGDYSDSTDCEDPPCTVGQYYGQVEIICDCEEQRASSSSSSSSSSTTPDPDPPTSYGPWDACCEGVNIPAVLYLNRQGYSSSCPTTTLDADNLPLIWDEDTISWRGYNTAGTLFIFECAYLAIEDEYAFTLQATNGECEVYAQYAANDCEPFEWEGGAAGLKLPCCGTGGESTAIVVNYTVTEVMD